MNPVAHSINLVRRQGIAWPAILLAEGLLGMCILLFPSYLILGFMVGIFVFFITMRNPFNGYILFLMLLPFWTVSLYQYLGRVDIRPSDIMVLVIMICFLIKGAEAKRLFLQSNPIKLPLLLFLSWITLSFLWNESFIWGLLQWTKVITAAAVFLLTYNLIKDRERLDLVITLIIAVTVVFAVMGILHFVTTGADIINRVAPEEALSWGSRKGGLRLRPAPFLTHAHKFGAMMNYGVVLAMWRFVSSKSKVTRIVMALALPVLFLAVVISFSRISYIALVVVLSTYCISNRAARKGLMSIVLLLLLVTLAYAPFRRAASQRVYEVFNPKKMTTISRPSVYLAGLRMFAEHPIVGVGIGSFPLLSPRYGAGNLVNPHNIVVYVLATYGVVGMMLYILIAATLIRKGLQLHKALKSQYSRKTLFALFLGLVMYQIMMMADSYRLGEAPLWMAVGLTVAAMNIFGRTDVRERDARVSA
ncbi:MAG: O-antigen ligase family protein [Deltaproteobacteria bacterium]|nr:O-antigen ligase family protein [Deltaproteobacteria bacterium]